jgi:hypothetical protein
VLLLTSLAAAAALGRTDPAKPGMKTESFDRDPGWEGHNNRMLPKLVKPLQKDFGYRAINFAGKETGEQRGQWPAFVSSLAFLNQERNTEGDRGSGNIT